MNRSAAELMQYRNPPRSLGPSGNTCPSDAIAQERLCGPAKPREDRFQNRTMVQRDVRALSRRYPRRHDKRGHANAVRCRQRCLEIRRRGERVHARQRPNFGGRRHDMVVEAAVLVVRDDQQRLQPKRFVRPQLVVDSLEEDLAVKHVGHRMVVIFGRVMHRGIDERDRRQVAAPRCRL